MSYLQQRRRSIMQNGKFNGYMRTVSGYPLTLTDCLGGRLSDYKIYGNTVDNQSVGDYDSESGKYKIPVTVSGINLFNKATITEHARIYVDGKVRSDATAISNNSSVSDYIPVKPDTVYSVNYTQTSGLRTGLYDEHYTFVGQSTSGNKITTGEDTAYIRITFSSENVNSVMLVKGSYTVAQMPAYESYHQSVTTDIYLDEPVAVSESIDYGTAKVSIPVYRGTNIITAETTVSPSNMEVSYYSDVEEVT